MRPVLALLCGFSFAYAQTYPSGTLTAPTVYTGVHLTGVLHCQNAVFSRAALSGNFTLGSDCVNVILDHPTGSGSLFINILGTGNGIQYGQGLSSTDEVLIQLAGSNCFACYNTVSKCSGRAFQVAGDHNLVLGNSVSHACGASAYGQDDGSFYAGLVGSYNRFIGNTSTQDGGNWSYYLDNHNSTTTVQGNVADKPGVINGGAYDTFTKNHLPGITVYDREWDLGIPISELFVIGDILSSNNCPVTISPTLNISSSTKPVRNVVTVQ